MSRTNVYASGIVLVVLVVVLVYAGRASPSELASTGDAPATIPLAEGKKWVEALRAGARVTLQAVRSNESDPKSSSGGASPTFETLGPLDTEGARYVESGLQTCVERAQKRLAAFRKQHSGDDGLWYVFEDGKNVLEFEKQLAAIRAFRDGSYYTVTGDGRYPPVERGFVLNVGTTLRGVPVTARICVDNSTYRLAELEEYVNEVRQAFVSDLVRAFNSKSIAERQEALLRRESIVASGNRSAQDDLFLSKNFPSCVRVDRVNWLLIAN